MRERDVGERNGEASRGEMKEEEAERGRWGADVRGLKNWEKRRENCHA